MKNDRYCIRLLINIIFGFSHITKRGRHSKSQIIFIGNKNLNQQTKSYINPTTHEENRFMDDDCRPADRLRQITTNARSQQGFRRGDRTGHHRRFGNIIPRYHQGYARH